MSEHDLRANASRLSRGKTGIHPSGRGPRACFSGSCSRNLNAPYRLAHRESSQSVRTSYCAEQGVSAMDMDRMPGSEKDVAGKGGGAVGDIAGNAQAEAAGRAREAAGTVQNLYGQAKDAARDAGDAAVSYAKDAYENSGDTFREGSEVVAKKVQDNPLGALLRAGGVGFALARLMTRPPRRPPQRWRYYS